MLSFTAPQIEALGGEPARGRLQAFVRTAERRGFGVRLLLGEPSWILPEHRGDLIALLKALSGLPFAGVNLDLEPNQLDEAGLGTTYLLEELLKTLADAKLASPWPVALSIHPRYMAAPLGDIDFATALETPGARRGGAHDLCGVARARPSDRDAHSSMPTPDCASASPRASSRS